ncbi:hypothetical protein MSKU15_1452 [Komagataeibacter diospyri]|uniref:hypothetical protein n=1 Tax=Komagataeibacter diospyri TaxID=1932662 RepID=UPI001136B4FB|nr:hypothetical protein [Komagataeibacter diospyri]GCE89851.1 hypothetical protein MSKU15_1452 [Komagataeibacter diospyri]
MNMPLYVAGLGADYLRKIEACAIALSHHMDLCPKPDESTVTFWHGQAIWLASYAGALANAMDEDIAGIERDAAAARAGGQAE